MDESSACNRYFKPAGKVIFIPCDLTTRRDDPPSSSNIRALVEKTHVDRLREKLGDLVLSPDIFTTFVGERPRLRLRPKVEKAREKTAEEIAAEKAEAWNNIVW